MSEKEINILIVDDIPENVDVLKKTLEEQGYTITMAPSGDVALKIAPQVLPDLILLDVMMPGLNGFETCVKIKAIQDLNDIPVIFVTGKAATEDIVNGFEVGGVDYITKPFNQKEILSRVRAHIELLHTKRKVKQQNKELKELNHIKNKFLGVASHDLRGALTGIIGYLDLCLSDFIELSEQEEKEYIARTKNKADLMLEQVNNLLDVSSIEKGEINLVVQKHRLNPLVDQFLATQRLLARTRKIEIEEDVEEIDPIVFDSQRIYQVLNCLMSNALKFSKQESKVFFSMKKINDHVKLSIGDLGPGFSKEDEAKIFKEKPEGIAECLDSNGKVGFSLYIARKIIEAHKGQLKSEKSSDAIHSVTLTLPLSYY
jgi:two-component system sensor histidine kinase/response regulator